MTNEQRISGDCELWPNDVQQNFVELSHEDIAKVAYEIWEARGGGHGNNEQDWLDAERRLKEMKAEAQSA